VLGQSQNGVTQRTVEIYGCRCLSAGIDVGQCEANHQAFVIKSPVMLSPAWLSTFIGAAFALPANAMAIASALSGDGSPRLPMSSFDSILMRPRESMPHLIEPSWAASLSSSGSMSISPCSRRSHNVQWSSARALTKRSLSIGASSPL
jgi:hypothetical protein